VNPLSKINPSLKHCHSLKWNLFALMRRRYPIAWRPPALPNRIAVVGNYLPRHCGIATFTTDLCDAIHAEYGTTELLALPVNDTEEGYAYPSRVRFELSEDNPHRTGKRGFSELQQHRPGLPTTRIWNFWRPCGCAYFGTLAAAKQPL
jgi:hypothetical protein